MTALDSRQAGKSIRGVTEDLFGVERVSREWHSDGDLRATARRRIRKSDALMNGGYLEFLETAVKRRRRR